MGHPWDAWWTKKREKKKMRGTTRPSGRRGRENQCQNGMMKKVEANGAANPRRVLPGTREMMDEAKKIRKKETMRRSTTMEAARMTGEPLV